MSHFSYRFEHGVRHACYMKLWRWIALTLVLTPITAIAQRKGTEMLLPEDKTLIGKTLDTMVEAWKQRDMTTFATLFTEDCDFVNVVGMHWKGRTQVTEAHRVLLSTRYKGVDIHNISHNENEIAPGVAVVVWKSKVDDYTTPQGERMTDQVSLMTLVMLKQDGHWLIRAAENVFIDPKAAPHDPGRQAPPKP
jgi:uncharacterized protein (TIGR02246 family)